MKKIILIIVGLAMFFIASLLVLYEIKNSNPYSLKIDEKYMDYKDVEYENLYQVSYGEILNILSIDDTIDKKQCNIHEIYVDSSVAESLYVGQYIEKYYGNIFYNKDIKDEKIRIVAIEDEGEGKKITYISSGRVSVKLNIDEQYINKITEKNEFEIVIDSQKFIYMIKSIGKEVIDSRFNIDIEILDDEAKIRPGMSVNVDVIIEKKENVLCVPISCLNTNDIGQNFVLKKNNEKYEMTLVNLGIIEDNRVEVSGDIQDGDLIVDKE